MFDCFSIKNGTNKIQENKTVLLIDTFKKGSPAIYDIYNPINVLEYIDVTAQTPKLVTP